MWRSRAAVCVDYFDNSATIMMRMQENQVSYSVEKDGETNIWDGGQCEVVGEGIYDGEAEGEGQELGGITSITNSLPPEYEVDEQELQLALAMSEEDPRMDEELAKRLSELDSVPHVPKVNTEILPVEASDDKQRLTDRISLYGLAERKVAGDGNCQFRALSDQLYRTPDHHMFVRKKVVDQLTEARDSYSGYVPMEYNKYLKNMARYGEWGDHVTLQAAADFYGVKISLITSFKGTHFIEIIPAQQKSNRGLFLSFWSEIHYNSIYPAEESYNFTKKKKKPWFSF
ncbi:hypothetical protein M758_8G130100 [Ceratodon purpureus]|uniref:ubiquitinyl hydrolase 1 n=1 Tax=Ceratodon purpureus TaxID=3225 RepID=A0A8T0H0U0_CERPU|nr:hypothetical protein KC19_8G135000 [Ceratodon purpureus]KAG0608760.1 hypothetical protein M758_8G130100 [Ceratodon purpureus]